MQGKDRTTALLRIDSHPCFRAPTLADVMIMDVYPHLRAAPRGARGFARFSDVSRIDIDRGF